MNTPRLALAQTDAEIASCHAVMRELRPHHGDEARFLDRVRLQEKEGYRLAFIEADGVIRAVAGFRIFENLFSGRVLYVDDLVTTEHDRSAGHGGKLFDWLVAEARRQNCDSFELDSGVQRFAAHRFYFIKRMKIASYHFSLPLKETPR